MANKCLLCGTKTKTGEEALFHFAEKHPKEAREAWSKANMEESQMDTHEKLIHWRIDDLLKKKGY